ncbi:unnamed protein product [Ilex paraguariensis]|uniref:ESF1 RRM domain-containing protein n=1 Tax=Ilex paraguariensis TaxID=185542 RepID=A0ABC8UH12_9AQUA
MYRKLTKKPTGLLSSIWIGVKWRYYYAVVECDSSATADYLYKRCDGLEFEGSSNKLDLRFIPDSMEFKHPPHDVVTEVSSIAFSSS